MSNKTTKENTWHYSFFHISFVLYFFWYFVLLITYLIYICVIKENGSFLRDIK